MSLTVTVVDEQTGESETQRVADGDYVCIVAAPCEISHIQVMGATGRTHQLTIKRDPRPLPTERELGVRRVQDIERRGYNPPYPGLVVNDPDAGL